ncbi:ATP-dependent helicase HrpB [Sneathiella sp.]|uniref:ATP-dependent helicase HrpB n=1 Tax=Sneathiella sp. TaxID=1964365 RepID=UPI0035658CB5
MKLNFPETGLPVANILPDLAAALSTAPAVILQAAPGAGKTTLVPLFLLKAGLCGNRKIIMLEPRRLAARAAARRMADLLGEEVGDTVGYRVRLDSRVSARTRIEVVTEGILTRRMQDDPELADVGIIIFDEFHERSLQTDLGLALVRQVQEILRADLKLVVMSATLETERLAAFLNDAPVLRSVGRQFLVETRFLDRPPTGRPEREVALAVEQALANDSGDILVFLPGAGEINRAQAMLGGASSRAGAVLVPLYGNLPQKEQDRAILADAEGRRKIVLSTDIAETSLTIEGVRIVIDAGLARYPRFDPNSGMSRLETRRVSRASADQRRGRAGRLGPGVCYRLWTAAEDRGLIEHAEPEIVTADLSALLLELAKWGVCDVADLAWMTVPPPGPVAQGRDMLTALGALDPAGKITALGEKIVRLPLHPRLAGMVIRARALKAQALACDIAALLSERDILSRDREAPNADLRDRLEMLASSRHRSGKGAGALGQVARVSRDIARRLKVTPEPFDPAKSGALLAFAYSDRIGELREGSMVQYRLSGGRGARLADNDKLQGEPYLVAADLDGKGREATIRLAAPITHAEIEQGFAADILSLRRVFWDEKKERVLAVSERKLGALVLECKRLKSPEPAEISAALLSAIRQKGLTVLPFDEDSRSLMDRLCFAAVHQPNGGWPDSSEETLLATLDDWLLPFLGPLSTLAGLKKLNIREILLAQLDWDQQKSLDRIAPERIVVPSGSTIRLDYSNPQHPVLAVRLQEVFGLEDLPKLANGAVAITAHLLSPARRPVQITEDLASFWSTTYGDVKKDLKGRYPRHYWPDDPLQAEATAKLKPRPGRGTSR